MLKKNIERESSIDEILRNTIINIKCFDDALECKGDYAIIGKSPVNE